MRHLQSSYYTTCNERLDSPNDKKHDGRNPDKLPVTPLYHARVQRRRDMDETVDDQSPVQGEAPHVRAIIQEVRLRGYAGEGPYQ